MVVIIINIRRPSWYLATKLPLHDAAGNIIGLASISRDLCSPRDEDIEFAGLAKIVTHIQQHLDEPLHPAEFARIAHLSAPQLDRRMRRTFRLSTAQFIRKTRIGHAADLFTRSNTPVAEIARCCGYSEQSSFTRQFRTAVRHAAGRLPRRHPPSCGLCAVTVPHRRGKFVTFSQQLKIETTDYTDCTDCTDCTDFERVRKFGTFTCWVSQESDRSQPHSL